MTERRKCDFQSGRSRVLRWIALFGLAVGVLWGPARAEARQEGQGAARGTVTGVVTDAQTGQPIVGVMVTVVGTRTGALTDEAGRYVVQAPPDGVLSFAHIGYRDLQVNIEGRARIDVALEVSAAALEQIVVTGYQTQRRGDITSAVSTVNLAAVQTQTSTSVIQRLAGRVAGVQVETSGSPGARSTVRIRGVTSFQNNNPLYIIDGVPVEDSYANFLNPNDVESVQVLKDASAASVYGSRASNGVIIITTKKGQRGSAPQVTVDVSYGLARAYRGYDDFLILDPLEYFEFERRRYRNAGLPFPASLMAIYGDTLNPSIPKYIYAENSTVLRRDEWGRIVEVDESRYSYPDRLIMPGSPGTNWWDEVFGTGQTRDVNVAIRGGGQNDRYSISFGYFDQLGTARGNRFRRGTVRVNTDFNVGRLMLGENFTLAGEYSYGGIAGDNFGEGSLLGKNILSQPIIPVYDIRGNYASGKASGLGNNTNPVKEANRGPENPGRFLRIFGNAFARLNFTDALWWNTSLGINLGGGATQGYNPITPENSEPNLTNSINESTNYFTAFTLTNTLNFQRRFLDRHSVTVLLGQEAIHERSRSLSGSIADLVSIDENARYIQNALADPDTRNVSSSGSVSALLSWFGKIDYNYADRYYLSGTLRRDGSSRLAKAHRWGTFPAFSAGWRISSESFLADNPTITNLMLRFGWGVTGNQSIPSGRTVSLFGGGTDSTFYDIGGNNSLVTGYRQTVIGNPNLKWEENRTVNLGLDLELFGRATLELDVYERNSDNLLFDPPLPATAGRAAPPIVNIGQMRNRGIDGAFGIRGDIGEVSWSLSLNGSHYRNEIVRIDGKQDQFLGPEVSRNRSVTINRVGYPIGSFYGYRTLGYYQSQEEIDQLNARAREMTGDPTAEYFPGAGPGRIKFADINGRDPVTGLLTGRPDGIVNEADRTIIGSPHPDFTGGLNLTLNWRNFDFALDLFGSFGNEIWDVQKEFYVFAAFPTNVRRDRLTHSWDPSNPDPNAKYPIIDANDQISWLASDFYVEDGSYVRLRSLQIGYTLKSGGPEVLAKASTPGFLQPLLSGFRDVRVFLRAENLFTITGYDGLDPALPALAAGGAAGDIRDQVRGIDRGVYPTSRVFTMGLSVGL